nr:hypothetical protein CTI12_AA053730 [Tanacetum cinerariifolium]
MNEAEHPLHHTTNAKRSNHNDQNLHSTNELEDEEGEVNAYWAPNIESKKDKSTTNYVERKDDEVPSLDGGSEHEEPLDVDNGDFDAFENENNDSDSSSEMSSTSWLMREVDVRGVDSVHVDSFEEDHFACIVYLLVSY